MLKKIIMLVLTLSLALAIVACSQPPEEECTAHVDENKDGKCDVCEEIVEPQEDEKPQDAPKEITLIKDGKANFQIVTASTTPSGATFKKAVDGLASALEKLDVDVDVVSESTENAKACEVIIGIPTTRGDAYSYDVHDLGPEGYLIKLIDGRILIAGGSEEALIEAISVFTEDFLGIDKKTKKLDTVVVKASQNVEEIQDDYRITSLKVNGNDMKGFTIAADTSDKMVKATAESIQNLFYTKTGYWFEIVTPGKADKSIVITVKPNTYEGNGFSISVEDTKIVIETEFPNKLQEQVDSYLATNVTVKQGDIDFTHQTHKYTKNVRDICYEDKEFGATNNGQSDDDFQAIKACHDYANLWGHNVVGKSGSTYCIGKVPKGETIYIKTNVDWKNCKIILDDSQIGPNDKNPEGLRLREIPLFRVVSNYDYGKDSKGKPLTSVDVSANFAGKQLLVGATNIGFAPGFDCLVKVMNSNVKHYIRYGLNQNNGNPMQEVLIVDKDGNISSETPVVWNYEVITSAYLYYIEDRAITLQNLKLDTIANQAPNYYTAYSRGIRVERSNTTVKGIDHSMLEEGPTKAPYEPILDADLCYNVTFEDCLLQYQQNRYDAGTGALLGTYELGGTSAVKITWRRCRQKNFFTDDGTIVYQGLFGSNYCRNVLLEECFLNSFDAHCGLTNVTIRNSTFEHINCIGNGEVLIENVTVYSDGTDAVINLRQDYGSTWNGNVTIDGLHFKYMKDNPPLGIFQASYIDWNFGYQCYFPQNVTLKRITSAKVAPTVQSSTRLETEETVLERNKIKIHLCSDLELKNLDTDLSTTLNNYQGTKTLTIENCPDVPGWVLPNIPMFKDMRVFIDGEEELYWKNKYGATLR